MPLANANEANATSGWKSLAEVVASIAGAAAVLSALLLFFGYESTSAYYGYYGVPVEVLGLSPTDYLLRSPDSLFEPLVWATVAAFVIYIVTCLLRRLRRRALEKRAEAAHKWWHPSSASDRTFFSFLLVLAIVAAGYGIAGLLRMAPSLWAAFSLALAAVLIIVLYLIHREQPTDDAPTTVGASATSVTNNAPRVGKPGGGRPIAGVAVIGAVLLFGAVFWAATIYARHLGATEAMKNFDYLPEVTIYAKNEVMLDGPQKIRREPGAQWKYNYPNYHLLQYGNGRWIVTHKTKDPDHPDDTNEKVQTFILPRDEANFVVKVTDPHFHQA
jgi:hypothetical protein